MNSINIQMFHLVPTNKIFQNFYEFWAWRHRNQSISQSNNNHYNNISNYLQTNFTCIFYSCFLFLLFTNLISLLNYFLRLRTFFDASFYRVYLSMTSNIRVLFRFYLFGKILIKFYWFFDEFAKSLLTLSIVQEWKLINLTVKISLFFFPNIMPPRTFVCKKPRRYFVASNECLCVMFWGIRLD